MRLTVSMAALLGFALISAAALGQSNPLRGAGVSGGPSEPDQPVKPDLPTVERRGVPPPDAPRPPFTLSPAEQAQVDRVLNLWEQRNKDVKTFDCRFKRWTYDVVFGPASQAKFVEVGVLKYAAPDRGMFRVETTEKEGREAAIEPARAEHWISDGESIFEYNHTKKQLVEHKLPPELRGTAIADSPLPFLFGAEAQKLKQRYWIRVVTPPDVKDQIWLEAYPRHQQDAANFYRAQFIIAAQGMSPFALKLVQPNQKDYMVYQFFEIVVNDPLRLFKGDPFRAGVPLGWQKLVEEPPPAAQARR